ncbi:MAG: STELLO glycosyltransferase family protein [bacterium]
MKHSTTLIVTSIAGPNGVLKTLARGAEEHGWEFIVIGDEASPADFNLQGCRFFGLKEQYETLLKLARLCPTRHYARKNLGYLLAARANATIIVETDDDNIPYEAFWSNRERNQSISTRDGIGWVNVYHYFSDAEIWPRGFPLARIKDQISAFASLPVQYLDCPIQQGLVNENPDVDAIYRLVSTLPQSFRRDRRIGLTKGAWCPFSSQNTTWWRDVFPLMYLPAFCSFRMTDIWRSFVAQRIAWANDWGVMFHEPTLWQERNEHDLLRDFRDEIPGYLHNESIREALEKLSLRSGVDRLGENLQMCYEQLVSMALIDRKELALVAAWLEDLELTSL